MIQFLSPEWFFLVPLLVLAGWKYKRLRLASPVRLLIQAVLVLALAQPVITRGGSDMDLWVLIDQSGSTDGAAAADAPEIQSILERSKRPGDRIRLVDFAREAVLRGQGDPVFNGGPSNTCMAEALAYTLAQMEPDRVNRILMVTDGWPTSPLDTTPEQLLRARVPVDYRMISVNREADIRIDHIKAPARIRPGEAFLLEVAIAGPPGSGAVVPWRISRNGGTPLTGQAVLVDGKAVVRLTDRLSTPGCAAYDCLLYTSPSPRDS